VDAYEISTDPARLDVALIHRWLSEDSYWSKAIPREIVERALAGSLTIAAAKPPNATSPSPASSPTRRPLLT
jgi:hypothetical protein